MINYISGLVFVVLLVIGAALALAIGLGSPAVAVLFAITWLVADIVAVHLLRSHAHADKVVTTWR